MKNINGIKILGIIFLIIESIFLLGILSYYFGFSIIFEKISGDFGILPFFLIPVIFFISIGILIGLPNNKENKSIKITFLIGSVLSLIMLLTTVIFSLSSN